MNYKKIFVFFSVVFFLLILSNSVSAQCSYPQTYENSNGECRIFSHINVAGIGYENPMPDSTIDFWAEHFDLIVFEGNDSSYVWDNFRKFKDRSPNSIALRYDNFHSHIFYFDPKLDYLQNVWIPAHPEYGVFEDYFMHYKYDVWQTHPENAAVTIFRAGWNPADDLDGDGIRDIGPSDPNRTALNKSESRVLDNYFPNYGEQRPMANIPSEGFRKFNAEWAYYETNQRASDPNYGYGFDGMFVDNTMDKAWREREFAPGEILEYPGLTGSARENAYDADMISIFQEATNRIGPGKLIIPNTVGGNLLHYMQAGAYQGEFREFLLGDTLRADIPGPDGAPAYLSQIKNTSSLGYYQILAARNPKSANLSATSSRYKILTLAEYYLAHSDYTFYDFQISNGDLKDRQWFTAMAYDIGQSVSDYYLFATIGITKIYARNFQNALVLTKFKGDWGTLCGNPSTHDLGGSYQPLNSDGTLGSAISQITLNECEGAILIPAGPCNEGEIRNCTTTQSCPGTQQCVSGNWTTCNDNPTDNCPCTENWICGLWGACVAGTQTRTCTDLAGCSIPYQKTQTCTPNVGTISVQQITPTSSTNVIRNQPFTFTTSVTCSNYDCGNIGAVLDPIKVFQEGVNGYAGTEDTGNTGIRSSGANDIGWVSELRFANDIKAGLLFKNIFGTEINQIPLGSTINSATLTMTLSQPNNIDTEVFVHRITDPNTNGFPDFDSTRENKWTYRIPGTEWNIPGGDFTETGKATTTVPGTAAEGNSFDWDITEIVQTWSNGAPAQGFILFNNTWSIWFHSSEASENNQRPKLTIDFTDSGVGSKNGAVPETSGNPFYTTDLNPQTCTNLQVNQTCTNTWEVIPTGNIGSTFEFYVIYDSDDPDIGTQFSSPKAITITESGECTPYWDCPDWSTIECIDGTQNRTCTDTACGTGEDHQAQACTECTEGATEDCTFTEGIETCDGQKTCTNGTWGDCVDIYPLDNCPVTLTCSIGLIEESCFCGNPLPENIYSDGYCCIEGQQEEACPSECPEEITEECYCGTERYAIGYCCDDTYQTDPCTCESNWECDTEWGPCIDRQQTKTCRDTACGKPDNQETQTCGSCDLEETQECTIEGCDGIQICENYEWASCEDIPDDNCPACEEEWIPTAWSECINGEHTRTWTDNSNCGEPGYEETEACGPCSGTDTQNCITSKDCDGIQNCIDFNWGQCKDIPDDNCPCIEDWDCDNWSACSSGIRTRACADSGDCGTTLSKPSTTEACGGCTTGATQTCITNHGCGGTQICSNGIWGTCNDIPNDNCPSPWPDPTTLKEFEITIDPSTAVSDEEPFTIKITEKGKALSDVKIKYAEKTYLTKSSGEIILRAEKGETILTASKTRYVTQKIIIKIKEYECGNEVCETPYENTVSCPADCKTATENELKITTTKTDNMLTITVTDQDGNPIEEATVTYGGETKTTDSKGKTSFDELTGTQHIKAEKTGYKTKTILYGGAECIEEETKECTTLEDCAGKQTCVDGTWGACIDIEGDSCPAEEDTGITTIMLAVVLVIGLIVLLISNTLAHS